MRWISVKEALPKKSGNVLIRGINNLGLQYTWIYHFSTIDYEFIGNDKSIVTEQVTHWSELPTPPDKG